MNETDNEVIAHLNSIIATMRTYGVKKVRVLQPSYELVWSNGGASWYTSHIDDIKPVGAIVELDANEFLAPYPSKVLDRIVDKLNPLPLYAHSTEARMLGFGTAPPPETKHWTWPAIWEDVGKGGE